MSQSEEFARGGEGREALLRAYWSGYLAAVLAEHPDLLGLVHDLSAVTTNPVQGAAVQNTNSGHVKTLVQGGDSHGGITFHT
ncbi:hypothetical protein AB0436_04905 [Streptomyces sp. NPDC051322]|uniref:hypothetical protein n=1 Tax=Streptomyces sp. NPDC051322 TaxID=3154645 RepID=UPI00344D9564